MKSNKRIRMETAAGLLLLFLFFLVCSCGRRGGNAEETAAQRGQDEREEAVLNLQLDGEVPTLDPQAAVDTISFEIIACMTEGLYAMDENGQMSLAMAERMEVSQDGKQYLFFLRDAVWEDGKPVTAADFVYGWRRGIDPDQGNENGYLFRLAGILHAEEILEGQMDAERLGVRAADEKTLEVTLSRPVPYFISMLSLPVFYPVNQDFFESCRGLYGTSPETVLGNGPFCLERYQPACQELSFIKNPKYWRADKVKLDGLSYQVIKESQQAVMAYEKGLLDMALLSGKLADIYQQSPEFFSLPLGSLWYLSPNLKTEGLENENLRKALFLSYDRETAALLVLKDGSEAAWGAVPAHSVYDAQGRDFREWANEKKSSGQEVLDEEDIDGNNWKNKGESGENRDKILAQKYLEQAKKELGQESFYFTLLIEDTEAAQNLGQFLQEEIQNTLPGIVISLEPVPKKARLERMEKGDYELGLARWGADYPDPLAFLGLWTTGAPFNYGGWSDEEYDRLIDNAGKDPLIFDEEARWEAFYQAEQILLNQAAIFPLCEKANDILLSSRVKNACFQTIGVNRVWAYAWKEENK